MAGPRIVGIDPGVKGALVLLDGRQATILRMPLQEDGKSIDGAAIARWLFLQEVDAVFIEKLNGRNHFNKDGKAIRKAGNEWRFAEGYGILQGVCMALGKQARLVLPMRWKTAVLGGGTDKTAAIEYIQTHHPNIPLIPEGCRVPQDGIADAACIAIYGQKNTRQT